jgi:hypothetical protein
MKLIAHKNKSFQHCGISFVFNVMQRLNRVFSDAGINRNSYSDRLISASIFKVLPDFQTMIARIRYEMMLLIAVFIYKCCLVD